VNCLVVLSNKALVSGSTDKTIKLWDLYNFELIQTLEGHTSSVSSLSEMSNGKLASSSWDGTIKIWDLSNGGSLEKTLKDEKVYVARSLTMLKDNYLASYDEDCIYIWNAATGNLTETIKDNGVYINALTNLANNYLVSGLDRGIKMWKPILKSNNIIEMTTSESPVSDYQSTKRRKMVYSSTLQSGKTQQS
jgi:WD40 repeat protein